MIWTSTNKGLGFFDLESQKYHRIRTRLFNGISYLIADGKGRLWICAQNHLYSYIIKENRFILWNSSDGFPPNEILFAYQKQSNRDYIYLGGSEGLVKINTDIPYTETQIPEIYLSEILFNGSPSLKKVKENTIKYHGIIILFLFTSGSRTEMCFRNTYYNILLKAEVSSLLKLMIRC